MEILRGENISFSYPQSNTKAIDNVSFNVNKGEFIVVCGQSGCGKTTLLKMLKPQLTPVGTRTGEIFYKGIDIFSYDKGETSTKIGYVLQNPDLQIVTDKVWHELAFGLENMGTPADEIRRRTGEMASYFGIEKWFRKNTEDLSGGAKQLVNLASAMVMNPEILILDEPTSQLDPIAASEFIGTLQKLNKELGLTIIIAEHRLEDVFSVADKIIVMENGKILTEDTPRNVGKMLSECGRVESKEYVHPIMLGFPSATRMFYRLNGEGQCPLTVKEGREFLENSFKNNVCYIERPQYRHSEQVAIAVKNLWFRYEKNLPDVIRDASLEVFKGEVFCLLGGNGTGKTTLLKVISGIKKGYRGKVLFFEKQNKNFSHQKAAYLPQNPSTVFLTTSVREDLMLACKHAGYSMEDSEKKVASFCESMKISHLVNKNPMDLSGGEQQKAALAKILISSPTVILLDEPTKGMDAYSKEVFVEMVTSLKNKGVTVLIVTHDVEFAAQISDRCGLFFDGEVIACDTPDKFFGGNTFYTTAANRISRTMFKNTVTCDDVVNLARKNIRIATEKKNGEYQLGKI